jgi:2-hydroxychromene-2-carboxylate isomerase
MSVQGTAMAESLDYFLTLHSPWSYLGGSGSARAECSAGHAR